MSTSTKRAAAVLGLLAGALFAQAAGAADVGVSIRVGEPGFYGRIDIGNMPRPQLIYAEPVYVQRQPRVVYEPIYLRVPPGHERHWSKHCARYGACGRPVYFVRDSWYREVYAPQYRREHGERRDWDDRRGRGDGRGDGRWDDRRDDRGPGHGHGRDHGRGHRHD